MPYLDEIDEEGYTGRDRLTQLLVRDKNILNQELNWFASSTAMDMGYYIFDWPIEFDGDARPRMEKTDESQTLEQADRLWLLSSADRAGADNNGLRSTEGRFRADPYKPSGVGDSDNQGATGR